MGVIALLAVMGIMTAVAARAGRSAPWLRSAGAPACGASIASASPGALLDTPLPSPTIDPFALDPCNKDLREYCRALYGSAVCPTYADRARSVRSDANAVTTWRHGFYGVWKDWSRIIAWTHDGVILTELYNADGVLVAEETRIENRSCPRGDVVRGLYGMCAGGCFEGPDEPRIEGVHVDGGLPAEVVEELLGESQDLRGCAPERYRGPFRGYVGVRFDIGADGRAGDAHDSGSTHRDHARVECVLRAVLATRFPEPEPDTGSARVTVRASWP